MSLKVDLNRFKVIKCKSEKVVRLEFRGMIQNSAILLENSEIIHVNQRFEWPVRKPIEPGEVLTVELLTRGRWGPPKVVGVYRLGMQILVSDGQLFVTDTLVDNKNRAVPVYVEMEVFYNEPKSSSVEVHFSRSDLRSIKSCNLEQSPGYRSSQASTSGTWHGSAHGIARSSGHGSGSVHGACAAYDSQSSAPQSEDEENNELENIERNIAQLEKSMKQKEVAIDMGEGSRARRLTIAGKRFLRRGFSTGTDKVVIISETERKRYAPLRSVKSIMRMGRGKTRDSSGEEELALLEPTPGPSSQPDYLDYSDWHDSASSDEMLVHRRPSSTTLKLRSPRISSAEAARIAGTKREDFQVCVTVIEGRQLAGLNMDPVVCVQVGELYKYTSIKESTNCPYYNEYFVFDFRESYASLFEQIITISVLQSRNVLRPNKLLGSFKLDVATVWNQPDRQFFHKWALLTDPNDVAAGAKGYIKCDISVIGKGDSIKVPPKSEKDEDDIESNLLMPEGVTNERQRSRYVVKIFKADGLPKMTYSILANVKKAFTGESQDLVDPYVQVFYAGMTGKTSIKKNSCSPVWNEQIVFNEMFPPLCQRIKIQLQDDDPVHPSVIGTHSIDLNTISHDGDKGFLPTFGPAYVYLYGSTRNYSLMDQHARLNMGIGEGVAYRARLLISIRTEIIESIECPISEVEVEAVPPINELNFGTNQEFFLFGSVFDANMIDKRLVNKPIQFELSIGNAGNILDGHNESLKRPQDLDVDLEEITADTGFWESTTQAMKATSTDKSYYYLPYWSTKQCMHVRSVWPDHRRRMYNTNLIACIVDKFEESLLLVQQLIDTEDSTSNTALVTFKVALEKICFMCVAYEKHVSTVPAAGTTKLDKERQKICLFEIGQVGSLIKLLRALITKHSIKDRLRTAFAYLNRLKRICEDAQPALPDIFIWMISNGKRLAYYRVPARELIYSSSPQEAGRLCGKMQTVFLKWPGKKNTTPAGWSIPAKISVYLWLGILQDKKHYVDGLPLGYELSAELKHAASPRTNAPPTIYYAEKHTFQMRAYIYQARSLIGSDSSGLSDPFAKVILGDNTAHTQVIDETLSPTWDELLIFNEVLLYSTIEQIKADPPTIVIEIFDQDNVGKSEFIGRTLAKPHIRAVEDPCERPPSLEWHEITRGDDNAGELLATFELLEIPPKQDVSVLPELPTPRESTGKDPLDANRGPILPVPRGIRPTLSKYRIEILFWGLRDMKRVHFLPVDRPRVDIECAGNILSSTIIPNTKRNPNFINPIRYVDVELPDQDLYRPPLTIRVLDCRSFGRKTLVGTHTINSINKYLYTPMSIKEKHIQDRKKSIIPLQNIDLRTNRIVQEDLFVIENEKENSPLISREVRSTATYGSGVRPPIPKKAGKRGSVKGKQRKASTASVLDDDERSKDWWTKYFASVESMIEEGKEAKKERQGFLQTQQLVFVDEIKSTFEVDVHSPSSQYNRERNKRRATPSPKVKLSPTISKKNEIPKSGLTKILPHELEVIPEYEGFKEWLHSFNLYRGKKTGDDLEDESRLIGTFKGAVKAYKWPLSKTIDDQTVMGFDPNLGYFHGVPSNDPIHVLVRVYIVKATDLHPMDLNGKADPYIVLHLGTKRITDKEHYVSKQLNPVYGKCFEIEATFPQDSMLTIQVLDWDLLGADDLIGETRIDLENRFYSRHRGTCGLPLKYEEQGYNRWRDAMKPTQILAKLCKDGKLDPPIYEYGRVRIGHTVFNMSMDDAELFSDPDTTEEQMALNTLRRWEEVPRVGTKLMTEHVETRPLYNPSKPGIEQGKLEMWVDMFPMDMPLPGPPLDISPRKPKSYEMRVIIWNTDDVVLEDDAFFTGEKMSDIYVKGWLKGPEDCQSTDIHYRSLTGEGNFNWRFIYPFDYLEAEERIVISRKESVFSWDETECKIPARLELQVWDADHFSADDFLGALTLDLNRFPRGAKSSNLCTLDMLRSDGSVPMINIFKQKRVKGWWPFYIKRDSEEMELTGKVEAEIHLLTRDEAEKVPAGLGRNEPDPLEKPNRPDASFMWFLNPLKSIRYIIWHNYKWTILKVSIIISVAVMILFLVYAFPGYAVKKLLGA